jgi:hypothetical protein
VKAATQYALASLVGAVAGSATAFVYLNVDPLERMAAAADGFPRWTLWQLPFTIPEAALGAVVGVVALLVVRVAKDCYRTWRQAGLRPPEYWGGPSDKT